MRNVRAYQDRGLLPPPQRRGRNGIYTQDHLAAPAPDRAPAGGGYTLANIAELITAWEQAATCTS